MRTSLFLALSLTSLALACGTTAGDDSVAEDSAFTSGDAALVGDFHVNPRALDPKGGDEGFLIPGALIDLSVRADDSGTCRYQATQSKCDDTGCARGPNILDEGVSNRIAGTCSIDANVLTVHTQAAGDLRMVATEGGFNLTAASGQNLNGRGKTAFLVKTSRAAEDAFKRAVNPNWGIYGMVTKVVDPHDSTFSSELRASLDKLIAEQSLPEKDGVQNSVGKDGVLAIFATPFDSVPVAYAVVATIVGKNVLGERCINRLLKAVDTSGKRLESAFRLGDHCGYGE